jgi:protein-S-isoprenylcysteine O-methyltransferase Ste14
MNAEIADIFLHVVTLLTRFAVFGGMPMKTRTTRWLPIHLSHVSLMAGFYALSLSPLYDAPIYAPWRSVAGIFLLGLGGIGWIPLWRASSRGISLRESPYFLFLALIYRRFPHRRCRPSWRQYWHHPLVRYRWFLLVIKAYFLPLVLGNFLVSVKTVWAIPRMVISLPLVLLFVRRGAMIISSLVATAGYTFESRRYGAPIKAVETSLLGWFFCLSCYPPVRGLPSLAITGKFYEEYRLFAADSSVALVCSVAAAGFLLVHVWAIVNQGMRFANLTYRGTVTHGLFSVVRHPQYATKLAGWLFEWIPYFGWSPNVIFFSGWVGLYVGRALTEETFLSRFADYRRYVRRVRWRFIPGVW